MESQAPDEKFPFGYYRVETLVAFATSIGLMGVGGGIIYRSYLAFLEPKPLTLPVLALAVLLMAGTVSLYRAFQMRRIAGKYNILCLKLDANNAIKDGSASFLVFFTVLASTIGFHQMDAIGGMGIGVFILFVSYVVLKETALVLLDAYHNPQLVDEIKKIVESNRGVLVKDVLLRRAGSYVHAEIRVEVNRTMTVDRLDEIKSSVEAAVRNEFADIQRVVVSARAHSS